jgi:mono/diheme cytochrome c family protein
MEGVSTIVPRIKEERMRRIYLASAGLGMAAAVGAVTLFITPDVANGANGQEVFIPALSDAGARGQVAYGRVCASCHGEKIDGTDKGPPLMHPVYNPGHHGDASFIAAARRGAKQHHWPFGDMKPVEGVSDTELAEIIRFVREVQKANGLF